MDFAALPFDATLFLLGTFTAAFVSSLAGFAIGMVAAAIWLFALPPAQTTTLIVAYALMVQGYATWRLRDSIDYRRLLPFVIGSAIAIPVGLFILEFAQPSYIRTGVGALLIVFSLYNLTRPQFPVTKKLARTGDAGVGILNGVLGASTGLGGILPVNWTTLRLDTRRAARGPSTNGVRDLCHVDRSPWFRWACNFRDGSPLPAGAPGFARRHTSWLGPLRQVE